MKYRWQIEDILKNSIRYKTIIGIYFLINKKEIVYIGSSISCLKRINSHFYSKTFNSYFVIRCEKEKLLKYESEYIFKFEPKYNSVIPTKDNPTIKRVGTIHGKFKRGSKIKLALLGNTIYCKEIE